jgi:phosphonate transport system substrate-binding protein
VAYVRAHAAGDTRAIARTVTRGHDTFQLVLVTRTDSPIREPKDLVGRSFALGDTSAHLQRAVLLDAGLHIEQFRAYRYLGSFDNIVRGVLSGDFDAGIVKDTTAYQWEGRGLRVFHRSPQLPPYNIAVSRRVDDALAHRIQEALQRLTIDDPRHARVIRALDPSYDGFRAATDSDYDTIRRMVGAFPP